MITALSVNIPEKPVGIKKLTNRLKRDKVEIEIGRARGVAVKHITYTSFSGEIHLDKADKLIGSQRGQLLCSDKLIFPHKSGYRRFCSCSFSARLCTNMALEILRSLDDCAVVKLGIYDPQGVATDFLVRALEYCSNPVAVTQNREIYALAQERALDELGASAIVTKNVKELSSCNFIVAPTKIAEKLPLSDTAVVLTLGEPEVKLNGKIYGKYGFRMPNGFESLKPEELDEEYFCSALYILGSQYELGSIVPLTCRNSEASQTVKSMCSLIAEFS